MVLTALDDNLRNVAAGATDNQDDTLKKCRESVENVADLSIVVSSDDEDEPDAVRYVAKPPPRPAAAPSRAAKKQAASQQQAAARRRRRRSSARFLRLTGRFEEEDEEEEDVAHQEHQGGQEHLGEMYKRAIRMNAENRINAGNSWGLRLIENIDKFLVDDEQHETEGHRVNFTKASCTLDASVKIYSYRVDDVHLTSYKVLANLNRTETGKKQQTRGEEEEEDVEAGDESNARTHKKSKSSNERCGVTETLESNLGMYTLVKF
jgi:condensin complex subunit 2